MQIISVENITKRFGNITAVDGITFGVEENSIFGFLGPNGAGKTTTISILCTLLDPTSGKAFLNGHDCSTESDAVRKSIGIVFQDSSLDKDLTARENLTFHARLYRVARAERKQRVEAALEFAGLQDRADDLIKKFSGGMKRRLEVARGLIHRPKVLFLDEPTLGLDPQSRAGLWEFITELPKKHEITIFMTTHYMEEAEVCDQIAIIDKGKIIASGTPQSLKKLVGGDVIYLRTSDNTKAADTLQKLFGLEAAEKDGEIFISTPRGDSCIPSIIREIGDTVLSVRMQRPTLNDVFLKLTGKAIREEIQTAGNDVKETVRSYRRRHDRG
ncbi:MAG: ABC transporter ATP-binding protein [Thermodesulfovibrio sp.]|nr:ABC transporter ATP-binding protein [Thermodesulfovibrio sp.]